MKAISPRAAQETPRRLNAYAYAANNPLRLRDLSGLHICAWDRVCYTEEEQVWVYMEYENLAALDRAIAVEMAKKRDVVNLDWETMSESEKNYYRQEWLQGWRPTYTQLYPVYLRLQEEDPDEVCAAYCHPGYADIR